MEVDNKENIDGLTGLLRYSDGIQALIEAINRVDTKRIINSSRASSFGIVFADIYKLKSPHDRYGHTPVDDVIHDVGGVIKNLSKETDIAFRYGGDEFVLIMTNVTEEETKQRAEQIRLEASKVRIKDYDGQLRENIHLSIGTVHYPTISLNPNSNLIGVEALLIYADEDLQRDRKRNQEIYG